MPEYLHDHKEFASLINMLANEKNIDPGLIEKDYWIMHVLYGLKKQAFQFELMQRLKSMKILRIPIKIMPRNAKHFMMRLQRK